MRQQQIDQYTALVKAAHGNVITVAFSDLEYEALRIAADQYNDGDVAAYVRGYAIASLGNDLDVLRHKLKPKAVEALKKGGAR